MTKHAFLCVDRAGLIVNALLFPYLNVAVKMLDAHYATTDDIVRGAEAFANIGVSTVVTGAVSDDPAGWLEAKFGPAIERIAAIEPARL